MIYIDIGQWEHTVRGAQYDKAIWCWRKLSNNGWKCAMRPPNAQHAHACANSLLGFYRQEEPRRRSQGSAAAPAF